MSTNNQKSAKSATTGAEQVAILGALNQQAAAFLVGLTARSIRDDPRIPRAKAGTYDGPALVAWAARRVAPVKMTELETERSLNLSDLLFDSLVERDGSCRVAVEVADFLGGLVAAHGEQGLMVFAAELARRWALLADECRPDAEKFLHETPQARHRRIEERVEREIEAEAARANEGHLDIATVCETCERLRRGHAWAVEAPAPGRTVVYGRCDSWPDCGDDKKPRRKGGAAR
jgi:hypothetical protein